MSPPAASSRRMQVSMTLSHDEGIAYAIEGLCAIAASRGDVGTAATLAGAAETTRQRLTMNDAPHFVYHVRYLAAATTPDERGRGRSRDGAGTRDVGRRGRGVRPGERVGGLTARQPGRACRNRMRVPGRACASRSSAASVTTAITG